MYAIKTASGHTIATAEDITTALRQHRRTEGSKVYGPTGKLLSTAIPATKPQLARLGFARKAGG